MILAVCIVIGFKHQVESRVVGISSHIQVTSSQSDFSFEMVPIEKADSLPALLMSIPNVRHVQRFTTKLGMLKTDDDIQAVVFKGIDGDFDWSFLSQHITEGQMPSYSEPTDGQPSNQVMLSALLARQMNLRTGDDFIAYFARDERVTARKFVVSGLFDTHFSEFDKQFVLADQRLMARLYGWEEGRVGGLEIFVEDIRQLQETDLAVYNTLFEIGHLKGNSYYVQSVHDLNPDLFGWLDLLDMNVWLILVLMLFVAGFNMISGLLILMLERTNMIGMMKAMGADNLSVRRIFIWLSAMLAVKGIFWGDLIGLGIAAVQHFFRLFPLNPDVYYVSSVPIEFNLLYIVLLNVGTLLASLLMMLLPTAMVSRILPARSIKFD